MVELLSIIIGFFVGAVAVAVTFEIMGRGRGKPAETSKLTSGWRLSEFRQGILIAHHVGNVGVHDSLQVYASGIVDPSLLQACQVKQVPPVRARFALDGNQERALLFLGDVEEGDLALLLVEPAIVERLANEAKMIMDHAESYVEARHIKDLAGRNGVDVVTQGAVQDVVPYKGKFMLRLEDQGHTIGVLVNKDASSLQGRSVRVRGHLGRDKSGYPTIEATDIRRIL